MKILNLKLRGAIGIKKGQGLDEIEVDFTKFQSGLIAVTGRNGSGKTSILEQLHPFRCMVSREGSLQSHFFLKDSYRILTFEHDGVVYESKILIDALTGGSEAYLMAYTNDGACCPLNDGKLTTYDQQLEEILGSRELFFNSVFSGQKSKGIAELKPADRRKLFYELLNLTQYEAYLERAKAQLKDNELKLATVEGALASLGTAAEEKEKLTGYLKEKELEEYKAQKDLAYYSSSIKVYQDKLNELNIEISKLDSVVKANDQYRKQIIDKENERVAYNREQIAKLDKITDTIEDYKKIISRLEKILANKEKIESSLLAKKELDEELKKYSSEEAEIIKERSKEQSEYYAQIKAINESENNKLISQLGTEIIELGQKQSSLRDKITKAQADSELIGSVPCTSEIGASCKFISNAYEGKNSLIELCDEFEQVTTSIREKGLKVSELQADIDEQKQNIQLSYDLKVKDLDTRTKACNNGLNTVNLKLTELNKTDWEKLHTELQDAEKEISIYNEKIASSNELYDSLKATSNENLSRLCKEKEELSTKIDNSAADTKDTLLHESYKVEEKLSMYNDDAKKAQESIYSIKENIAAFKERIEDCCKQLEKQKSLSAEKSVLESEIKDWSLLCKAFDKTGIPVLKLENSGVEITSVANELLSMFENKFRIVFETTSFTKDKKKLKETFDINIVEEDGVCEISNKSGGQQVWIETAIQLAISLVVRQQGRNIETSFLDEKDGALDLDNAVNYIQMLKRAHEMSGVHNTFVITHRQELLDFIPQQVKLSDGYLTILN